jgi:hypothetical protein
MGYTQSPEAFALYSDDWYSWNYWTSKWSFGDNRCAGDHFSGCWFLMLPILHKWVFAERMEMITLASRKPEWKGTPDDEGVAVTIIFKIKFKETDVESVNFIHLTRYKEPVKSLRNTVTTFGFHKCRKFLFYSMAFRSLSLGPYSLIFLIIYRRNTVVINYAPIVYFVTLTFHFKLQFQHHYQSC